MVSTILTKANIFNSAASFNASPTNACYTFFLMFWNVYHQAERLKITVQRCSTGMQCKEVHQPNKVFLCMNDHG